MSDSSNKKQVAIPDWQKTYTGSTKDHPDPAPGAEESTQTKEQLIEDAKQFLTDESIRDASRERKVAFLEKKGLQADDIQELLGPEHTTQAEDAPEMKTVHDSTTTPAPQKEAQEVLKAPSVPSPQASQAAPARDIPPIITYPEFLLKPQKPPPLVTFRRLAYAIYALAGVSTLTYGASKYLVQPMLETLTEARRDLAETTLADLEKLNTKLEANVSHVPVMSSSTLLKKKGLGADSEADDIESVDSDPTELFHRDIATQTSPQRSRSSSLSSSIDFAGSQKPKDATARQAARLSSLKTTLTSLTSSTSTTFSSDSLKDSIGEFQSLLDTVQLNNNPYQSSYPSIYPAYDKKKTKPGESSEAAKFKAEIRGLKGALLGARQFPVARPVPAAGYPAASGSGVAVR